MMRPSPATPSYGTTSSWNIAIGMGRGNFGYGFESIHSSPRYPEPGPRHLTRCPLRQYSDLASFLPVFHHFLCSHLTSPKPLLQTSLINLLTIERSLTSKKKNLNLFLFACGSCRRKLPFWGLHLTGSMAQYLLSSFQYYRPPRLRGLTPRPDILQMAREWDKCHC